jgi:serine/threonine protein kinase
MAPEILNQNKYKTPSDIYSFAISMFEVIKWDEAYPPSQFKFSWKIAEFVINGGRLPQPDDMKDDIIVNVKDLTYCDRGSWKGSKLITAQEMFNKIDADSQPQNITGNYSMTMREFILYFGMEVMQRYFGRNVWVNVAKADAAEYDKMIDNGNSYRIYKDLKTSAEAQFIHSLNGVIVKVIRPSNKKSTSGLDIVSHDTNADYILEVKGDLYSTMDDVKRLAKDIISRFK